KPRSLFSYFKSILQGKSLTTIGHNPASSWAALLMLALAVGLGITGYLMTSSGSTEIWEDAHELMAKAFLIVAIAHVAGIVLYTFRHKDLIGLSMVHGKKRSIEGEEGIPHYHRGAAALLLSLVVA